MMKRLRLATLVALTMAVIVGAFDVGRRIGRSGAERDRAAVAQDDERSSVVATARLEPGSRLIRVATPAPDVLGTLLVAEGDAVEAGQELAYLQSRETRRLEEQAARLRAEQARLQFLELESLQGRVRQAEAALDHVRGEVSRIKGLLERGLVSEREYDEAVYQAKAAEEELTQAQATLSRTEKTATLAEREAQNALEMAQRQLGLTVVRAPIAGRILRILARPGERVAGPLLEMGGTGRMFVVAEVHATEIHLVTPGQKAVFSSLALDDPLEGEVESVGVMVNFRNIFGEDATAVTNAKVFEVRVRMAPDEQAERFSNLDGRLRILLEDGPTPALGGGA